MIPFMARECPERGWLALAGGGLKEGHLTRELERLARCADTVLVETYTLPGSEWLLEELLRLARGRVRKASRSDLEEGASRLVKESETRGVLVVVPGDPLIATTHRSLIAMARRAGVRTILVPGVSGVCAAKTITGLDYYKYGRVVTIPGPWRMTKPYSTLLAVYGNLCLGLHTLLLLDIEPGTGAQLDPCRGIRMLLELEESLGNSLLARAEAILVERAAMPGERVRMLSCPLDEGVGAPASIVVPGVLAPYESEALESLHDIRAQGNRALAGEACEGYRALQDFLASP